MFLSVIKCKICSKKFIKFVTKIANKLSWNIYSQIPKYGIFFANSPKEEWKITKLFHEGVKKKFVFLLAELLLLDWFLLFWVVSSDINSIVACMLSAWQCWLSSLQTTSLSKTDEGAKNLKYSSYLKHSVFPPRVILFCLLLGGNFIFFQTWNIFSCLQKKLYRVLFFFIMKAPIHRSASCEVSESVCKFACWI